MLELIQSTTGIVVVYGDPEDPQTHWHSTATKAWYGSSGLAFIYIEEQGATIAVYRAEHVLAVRRIDDDEEDEEEDEEED